MQIDCAKITPSNYGLGSKKRAQQNKTQLVHKNPTGSLSILLQSIPHSHRHSVSGNRPAAHSPDPQ
jgi:hypothetical protein